MPAWIDRPIPTPPPWWMLTHVAPLLVLTSAFSKRPVGDRVRAVEHRFGLAIRRGDGARVEVIATDHDRRAELSGADHLVEPQAESVTLAVAEPADAGREPLERDPLTRHADPAVERLVVGELLDHRPVGGGDVGRVSRQGDPTEGALAFAEQRADVRRQEARVVERPVEPAELGFGAEAVAVVEHLGALVEEAHHRPAVGGHALAAAPDQLLRIGALRAWRWPPV